MAKKMLIDATHPEETRVVVVDGARVEEFDYESVTKQQIAGNIYLAKVTRVEPSLQAAFVDYGGNRHGFLAFAEIHPDYYQIPKADREALLAAEVAAEAADEEAAEEEDLGDNGRRGGRRGPKRRSDRGRKRRDGGGGEKRRDRVTLTPLADSATIPDRAIEAVAGAEAPFWNHPDIAALPDIEIADAETASDEDSASVETVDADAPAPDLSDVTEIEIHRAPEPGEGDAPVVERIDLTAIGATTIAERAAQTDDAVHSAPTAMEATAEDAVDAERDLDGAALNADEPSADESDDAEDAASADSDADADDDVRDLDASDGVEEVGAEDAREEIRPRRVRMRDYKVQEVIKKRQILLVQVVKEERGTKGAALTTYLSLAGRYCVLMPNTARGGGISRKITNAADRKRLKAVAQELDVPEGMGLIVRTAGANRTKAEIKRDYEYLLRQWAAVRELTLKSIAPSLIYEEGSLIKRAIRDLYNKDIDAVVVEGEDGYREAKDYMKMLMPSHAKNVQPYRDKTPLFIRHQVESQMSGMLNPTVQLKSGGYIVIGVTEALVAIDVNSGRSTKEGSIEETALKTNLEAAEEAARQMKLRDLAGLIVIDFIDMEESKNNRAVEKRLKDRLKTDRARIQIGRISAFGLLEMSRQRLRPGLLEATTKPCPHCKGTGVIRSDESLALTILRAIEEEGVRGRSAAVKVTAPVPVVNYLLNQKRSRIAQIEDRYDLQALVMADAGLVSPDFSVDRVKPIEREDVDQGRAVQIESGFSRYDADDDEDDVLDADELESAAEDEAGDEGGARSKRRRRRRKSGADEAETAAETASDRRSESVEEDASDAASADDDENGGQKKRRGKRGGRRRRKRSDEGGDTSDPLPVIDLADATEDAAEVRLASDDEASHAADEAGLEDAPFVDGADADAPALTQPSRAATELTSAITSVSPSAVSDPGQKADAPVAETASAVAPEPVADIPSIGDEKPSRRRTGWWNFRRGA